MRDLDRFIAAMPAEEDGDLMLCREHGVAYQRNRQHIVAYDEPYYTKCTSYAGQEIERRIIAGRLDMVARRVAGNRVLDVGIGSGAFVKSRPNTWGCDVNPVAIEWLKRNDLWSEHLDRFAGVTMWDVIEHLQVPELYLRQIQLHAYLFVSIPVFYGLGAIRLSKHYRPGEHLQYWTEEGFVAWVEQHGFRVLERSDHEIQAGRESVMSFALQRYRWPA
jgi:hypothetical protein